MNTRLLTTGLVVAALVAALGTALAQEKSPPSPTPEQTQQAMEAWLKLAVPGEHHKKLEPLVGSWETTVKLWMGGPGGEASTSKGTAETKWILGGRFVQETYHGEMMGRPFEGFSLTGYDNFRNVYMSVWADSMGTTMINTVGTVDHETGKVFRFYGQMDEPGLQIVGRTFKIVTRVIDRDAHVMEMYDLHVADDYKVMEVTYHRKK